MVFCRFLDSDNSHLGHPPPDVYWYRDTTRIDTSFQTSSEFTTNDYEFTVEPAGNLYRFVWSNNTDGVGIKQGDNIAVGIGGTRCGFVSYEIKADGLDGIWGGYGSDRTGTEKATKQ